MPRSFLPLFVFLLISIAGFAQNKPRIKRDTAKSKTEVTSPIETDSLHVKFPLPMSNTRFDRIDSADARLDPKAPIDKYGFIDTADLKITSCDFEKDAHAMVLFDHGEMMLTYPSVFLERHKRIKIFNEDAKDQGDIKIELDYKYGGERILGLEAETINLNGGQIEYTKLDPKQVYEEHVDRRRDEVVFSMPNVKAGSVIEYRYLLEKQFSHNFPEWEFQSDLPTRYSKLGVYIDPMLSFTVYTRKSQPFVVDSATYLGHSWALANVLSTKDEPFMRSDADVLQKLTFIISKVKYGGQDADVNNSWASVGKEIAEDKDFYKPFYQGLHGEDEFIKQAKALGTDDKKIAYLFDLVKNTVKWNEEDTWLSAYGIRSAWKKKTGNWGEINMILVHLLRQSGVTAYPMLVSSRDNGKIVPDFANIDQINKLVAFVPIDTARYYVLDASDRYNTYNEVPFELLNSWGLWLNKEKAEYKLVFLKKEKPVTQAVFIEAEISPDGLMKGSAQISSSSYNKTTSVEMHNKLDDEKYKQFLTDDDNNIRITSLQMENADVDSLPLTQKFNFSLDLSGTDEKYIFFNPNLFTSLHQNPFIDQRRYSDIDIGYPVTYVISGRYKIPPGYQPDVLPKNISLVNADRSISFKRLVGESDGYIVVSYNISYKKSLFPAAGYNDIYAYFKKMTDLLNEQIVLKKAS